MCTALPDALHHPDSDPLKPINTGVQSTSRSFVSGPDSQKKIEEIMTAMTVPSVGSAEKITDTHKKENFAKWKQSNLILWSLIIRWCSLDINSETAISLWRVKPPFGRWWRAEAKASNLISVLSLSSGGRYTFWELLILHRLGSITFFISPVGMDALHCHQLICVVDQQFGDRNWVGSNRNWIWAFCAMSAIIAESHSLTVMELNNWLHN